VKVGMKNAMREADRGRQSWAKEAREAGRGPRVRNNDERKERSAQRTTGNKTYQGKAG